MNLVFDLGNVLVRWDPVAIVRSVIDGPGAVRLAEHLFAHPDWVSVDRGSLTLEQAAERAIERTDVDDAIIHAAFAAVAPSLQPLPQSVALLDAVLAKAPADLRLRQGQGFCQTRQVLLSTVRIDDRELQGRTTAVEYQYSLVITCFHSLLALLQVRRRRTNAVQGQGERRDGHSTMATKKSCLKQFPNIDHNPAR